MSIPEVDRSWMVDGACYGQLGLTDTFFPSLEKLGGRQKRYEEKVNEAKAICAGCEVVQLCLEYAVVTKQDFGVWGGTDEKERRSLRRVYLRNMAS